MAEHYQEFKISDSGDRVKALKALIKAYPLAVITAAGEDGYPVTAYAPLTYRQNETPNGMVEFHLARKNPVTPLLSRSDCKLSISIVGPRAHISPSWYTARFSGSAPDRSRTAPTYNYVTASLQGAVQPMNDHDLLKQIVDLTRAHEDTVMNDGWKFREIDPDVLGKWCAKIQGFRMPIERLDVTAKLSQEQDIADNPGILDGLRERGDHAMASLIETFRGTAASLITGLKALTHQHDLSR